MESILTYYTNIQLKHRKIGTDKEKYFWYEHSNTFIILYDSCAEWGMNIEKIANKK